MRLTSHVRFCRQAGRSDPPRPAIRVSRVCKTSGLASCAIGTKDGHRIAAPLWAMPYLYNKVGHSQFFAPRWRLWLCAAGNVRWSLRATRGVPAPAHRAPAPNPRRSRLPRPRRTSPRQIPRPAPHAAPAPRPTAGRRPPTIPPHGPLAPALPVPRSDRVALAIRTCGSLALTMSLRSAMPHPIGDVLVVAILGQPRLQLLHALASVFSFQLGNAGFWRLASPLHPLRKSG
jgi:hypothetical protein